MPARPKRLVPFAHVQNVGRSVAFYARVGFSVRNTFAPAGASAPTWAFLEADGAELMVALADGPVAADQQAVLFYLYYDGIAAVHADLAAAGLAVEPLRFPPHAPGGEGRLTDPDGYVLMLTHT